MDVVERFAQGRQSVLSAHLGRQRLADALARDPPRIAHDRMEPFGSQHRRQPLGRGVDPLQTALGTPRQRLFDGLHFGMHQREFVAEERRAAEDEVFAPHFDALLDPLDPLEPHQLGLSRGIRDIGREASFASCAGIGHAGDATPELDERLPRFRRSGRSSCGRYSGTGNGKADRPRSLCPTPCRAVWPVPRRRRRCISRRPYTSFPSRRYNSLSTRLASASRSCRSAAGSRDAKGAMTASSRARFSSAPAEFPRPASARRIRIFSAS